MTANPEPPKMKTDYASLRREATIAMRRLLKKDCEFNIPRTISFLSLETGLGKKALNQIIAALVESGEASIRDNMLVAKWQGENSQRLDDIHSA